MPDGFRGLEIDHQLKLRWLLDRKISGLSTPEKLDQLTRHYVSKELDNSWAVANEATVLADFRRLMATLCRRIWRLLKKRGVARTLSAVAPELFAASMAPAISSGSVTR